MDKKKLIHQFFIGKVADLIGFDKTQELLKESHKAFEFVNESEVKTKEQEKD